MRLLEDWQYKYIEKCLFNYHKLLTSPLETEKKMLQAIDVALEFFTGTGHALMMQEFYFNLDKHKRKYTLGAYYRYVCLEVLFTEEPNGYVIRREIIYKIAMLCYELGVFKTKMPKK